MLQLDTKKSPRMTSFIKDQSFREIWTMSYSGSEDTLLHLSVILLGCTWELKLRQRINCVKGFCGDHWINGELPISFYV